MTGSGIGNSFPAWLTGARLPWCAIPTIRPGGRCTSWSWGGRARSSRQSEISAMRAMPSTARSCAGWTDLGDGAGSGGRIGRARLEPRDARLDLGDGVIEPVAEKAGRRTVAGTQGAQAGARAFPGADDPRRLLRFLPRGH